MTEFVFTGPDGRKFKVSGPEGATLDDAAAKFEETKQTHPEWFKAPEQPSSVMDFFRSIPRGIVGGMTGAASALGQSEANLQGMQGVPGPEESTELVEENVTGKLHKPQTVAGQYGETIAQTLGNPASWVGPGGPLMKAGMSVLSGAGAETAGQLTEQNPVARFVGGMAPVLPAAANALRSPRVPNIPPRKEPYVAELRAQGIEPTAGEVTGSRSIRHWEELGDLPGGGGSYSRNRDAASTAFSRRAIKVGIGEDADFADPEVLQRARERIGDTLEKTAAKLPINFDEDHMEQIVGIRQALFQEGLPDSVIDRINALAKNIISGFVTKERADGSVFGVMDGKTYQALTRKGTPLSRAMDDPDPNVSYYATRLRDALDSNLERSATRRGTREGTGMRKALAELKEARRQWYNLIVLSKSVAGAGEQAAEGLVSPAKLRQNLTGSPDAKVAYAAGKGGGLQELTRAGNAVLLPMKSSGSGERLQATTLTGLARGAAGRIVNSPSMQARLKEKSVIPLSDRLGSAGGIAARGGAVGALSSPDALAPEAGGDALSPFEQGIADFARGGVIGVMKGRGIEMPGWVNQANDALHSDAFNDALGVGFPVGMAAPWLSRAKQLIESGLTYEQVAERLGVTRNQVAGQLYREGLTPGAKRVPSPLDNLEIWNKAKQLRAEGKSFAQIADALGVSTTSVKGSFQRAGVQGREPGLPQLKFLSGSQSKEFTPQEMAEFERIFGYGTQQ